jgi:hypothetical protein
MNREAKRKWAQAFYVLYAVREIAKKGPKGPGQPYVDAPGAGLAGGLPRSNRSSRCER